jgi:hypothetical protein
MAVSMKSNDESKEITSRLGLIRNVALYGNGFLFRVKYGSNGVEKNVCFKFSNITEVEIREMCIPLQYINRLCLRYRHRYTQVFR